MYSGLEWWGYQHTNGTVHLKRYFDDTDLDEAEKSQFTARVIGPFFAQNQIEARKQLQAKLAAPTSRDRPMAIRKLPDEEKEQLATAVLLDLPATKAAEVIVHVCNSDDEILNEVKSQLGE